MKKKNREELNSKLRIAVFILMTISILLGAFKAYMDSKKSETNIELEEYRCVL